MAYFPMQKVGQQRREFPEPIGPIIGSLLIGRKALSSVHAVLPIPPRGHLSTMPAPSRSFVQRVSEAHACSPEKALEILARELQSPSQRFWSTVLSPWCGPYRDHYREVVQDLSRCQGFSDIKTSVLYWRQRSPEVGFLGSQFRVHTGHALAVFERYDRA